MQLVFGRDAILNIQMEADFIKERKQALINSNNKRENNKRHPHTYSVGDQILIRKGWDSKYGSDAYKGPYEIVEVRSNGTVTVNEHDNAVSSSILNLGGKCNTRHSHT
jgi:hypothetical protein